MSVTVKFFASLRETVGKAETQLEYQPDLTIMQAWELATGQQEMPNNTLCAINMEYVDKQHKLNDGDEAAFFPPVTGG